MGNIKTNFVKRVGKKLFDADPDKFSDKFSENKEIIKEMIDIKSKKLRNTIAGYITSLKGQNS